MKQTIPEEFNDGILVAGSELLKLGEEYLDGPVLCLSDMFNGYYEFVRMCVVIADRFVTWSEEHVDFDELEYPWLYHLEEEFRYAVQSVLPVTKWQAGDAGCMRCAFNETHCKAIAKKMELTLK